MAAAVAAGMTGREIREHALSATGSQRKLLSRFWKTRPASIKDIILGGFRVGQFDLERILLGFLPDALPDSFEDLTIPMIAVAADFYAASEVVMAEGPLRSALAASSSIPAVFRPVRRDGRVLVDGGMLNPVPFDHLEGLADVVVGVDVAGSPQGDGSRLPTAVEALYGASQLLQRSVVSLKAHRFLPDVLLRPEVGSYRSLDFAKAKEILEATSGTREATKRAVDAAMSARLSAAVA